MDYSTYKQSILNKLESIHSFCQSEAYCGFSVTKKGIQWRRAARAASADIYQLKKELELEWRTENNSWL
jgi:hypothetical protein